jgi:hypothetical protein
MPFRLPIPWLFASLAFVGCGNTVEQISGSGGATSSTSSSSKATNSSSATLSAVSSTGSSTGSGMHGECAVDNDCPGGMCVALTPGGYTVCTSFPNEATACDSSPSECCTSADCPPGAACYAAFDLQFCGGAFPAFNECVADGCQSDADCDLMGPPQICAPAGAFHQPKRQCMTAYCHTDADCNAMPGGECLLVGDNPCCTNPSPDGLGCVYPGDCAIDSDCPNNGTCSIDSTTGRGTCGPPGIGCPP